MSHSGVLNLVVVTLGGGYKGVNGKVEKKDVFKMVDVMIS